MTIQSINPRQIRKLCVIAGLVSLAIAGLAYKNIMPYFKDWTFEAGILCEIFILIICILVYLEYGDDNIDDDKDLDA